MILTLLTALPVFSQERPRILDDWSTSRGVQVYRTESIPLPVKIVKNKKGKVSTVAQTNNKNVSTTGKRLVEPTGMSAPTTKQPVTRRMAVSEGFADREMANYSGTKGSMSNGEYSNLLMRSANSMKGFTTGDVVIDSYIVDSSRKYSIDPLLIYAQMHQESSFKLKATSYKGASGLMQLMPATARRLGVTNIYDPKQNIEGGVKYMRMLLDMFGQDIPLALAGYNAGEGAVMKYGNNIPPYNETREYVRRITARYASISDGSFARNYKKVSNTKAAKLEQKEAKPLTLQQNAVAIRLPDGRLRLVNQ